MKTNKKSLQKLTETENRIGQLMQLKKIKQEYLFLNGEDATTAAVLSNKSIENYKRLL